MRIAFNGVNCGWNNNGGTQSIFRMADALTHLGVDVELWSDKPSYFTWFKPETILRQTMLKDAPHVDVLINTGCTTTEATLQYPRKRVGIQWLRAHETWRMNEQALFDLYNLEMPLWVNSEWEASLVRSATGRNAEIQYCGIPWQEFYHVDSSLKPRFETDLHVGALFSNKPRKRTGDIFEMAKHFSGVHFWLFGNEQHPQVLDNMYYLQQPEMTLKRQFYSMCDVWFAPSELEGLHIPPMEAALCGAAVLANRVSSAGNMDYCIDGETGLLYGSLNEARDCLERLRDCELRRRLNNNMTELVRSKIGDVKTNAERMIEKLERLL